MTQWTRMFFKLSLSLFFLHKKWLAIRQIVNRNKRGKIIWCYECPWAPAAVKTSNEAFGPHLALLGCRDNFPTKDQLFDVFHRLSLWLLHTGIYMLLTLTFQLPHGTVLFSQMGPGVGMTHRKYCPYIQVLATRFLFFSALQFLKWLYYCEE